MVSAAVLFLLTVGSVCGKASAERKLVYVTVVSIFKLLMKASETRLNSAAVSLWYRQTLTKLLSRFRRFNVFFAYL